MTQIPEIIRYIFPSILFRVRCIEKSIFLTFDDGPHPNITPQVLDLLDMYDAKATFFCVGENVERYPETYREIINRGHRVGNHTHNHLNGYKTSTIQYVENVKKANKQIDSNLFRPPYGKLRIGQYIRLKKTYKVVLWSIVTYDFNHSIKPERILKLIKKRSKAGSIVVYHDSEKAKKNILQSLPQALKYWKNEGYSLKAIEN